MKAVKKIAIYVDGESIAPIVLNHALHFSKLGDADILLLSVVETSKPNKILSKIEEPFPDIEKLLINAKERKLDEIIDFFSAHGMNASKKILVGDPEKEIVEATVRLNVDFLMKAPAPDDGIRGRVLGSIDFRLMRKCHCPVFIAKGDWKESEKTLIAALAYDPDAPEVNDLNEKILRLSVMSLSGPISSISIVHAWKLYGQSLLSSGRGKIPPDQLSALLEEEKAKRLIWFENFISEFKATLAPEVAEIFNPSLSLINGKPTIVIPEAVKDLDAFGLVMGTASRSGLEGHLIGNTVEEIFSRVNCTVVAVK